MNVCTAFQTKVSNIRYYVLQVAAVSPKKNHCCCSLTMHNERNGKIGFGTSKKSNRGLNLHNGRKPLSKRRK